MRWYVKKAARSGVAMGTWALGAPRAQRLVRPGPRVRALTYHRIGREPQEAFCVTPEQFEDHVRTLAENQLAIGLDALTEFVTGTRPAPDGACLITIDDGCISTLTEALPILRRWNVPAVAFVSAGLVGTGLNGLPERYMTWDELRDVADSGVIRVGSHAFTHRSLGLMAPEDARQEAIRSRQTLEDRLGVSVTSFCYPFGTRSDFNAVTERALADAGYTVAFNSMHGAIRPGMDPISLPRIKVEGGEGPWMFDLMRKGAMDTWRVVDANLWRLQRARKEIS